MGWGGGDISWVRTVILQHDWLCQGRDKQSSHPSALASSRPWNQTVENTAVRSSALKRDYMKGVIPAIILNTSACEIPHFFFSKGGGGEGGEEG